MSITTSSLFSHRRQQRRGMTLTELVIASTIMVMIVGAMSMLAMAVHSANDHCQGQATAAQHGRVALERISHAVHNATANKQFPGCLVVSDVIGVDTFPQTLVVWLPETAAANPTGLPTVGEIVVFTPNPDQVNCLLEVRLPGATAAVPDPADAGAWRTLIGTLLADADAERVTLTDRLRTADAGGLAGLRGCLRFHRLMAPSEEQWEEYQDDDLDWDELDWPLDSYSSLAGTRRVALQTELQLSAHNRNESAATALPIFGSAALTYQLNQ